MRALCRQIARTTTQLVSHSLRSLHGMSRGMSRGISFIELIVALGVSSVGIAGAFVLYSSAVKSMDVMEATGEMQQGFRKAFETMTLEIQETNVSMIDTSVPYAISFPSARQANVFQQNNDGTPSWQNAVVYFLDSETETLCRYVTAKTDWTTNFDTATAFAVENPQRLVFDVSNLQFQLAGNLLTITMESSKTLESMDTSSPVTKSLTTQVALRN